MTPSNVSVDATKDEGLELRDDFAEELKQSLANVEAGSKTVPAQKVAERLGLTW